MSGLRISGKPLTYLKVAMPLSIKTFAVSANYLQLVGLKVAVANTAKTKEQTI